MNTLDGLNVEVQTNAGIYYHGVPHIQPFLQDLGLLKTLEQSIHENTFATYLSPEVDESKRHCILYRIGQTDERTTFAKGVGEWACYSTLHPNQSRQFLMDETFQQVKFDTVITQAFVGGLIAVRNSGLSVEDTVAQIYERDLTPSNSAALDIAKKYFV